jgi:transcriptional regulator with XRE-family HTH domain
MREQVGRNIIRARQAVGLSQTQLAERLGIDRTQLSAWERARKLPSADKLFALSAATGHDHDFGWFYSEHGDDGA